MRESSYPVRDPFAGVAPGQSFPHPYGSRRAAPVTLSDAPRATPGQLTLPIPTHR